MAVRAKFKVQQVVRHLGQRPVVDNGVHTGKYETCELQTVTLTPVIGAMGENLEFWSATPSGKIELAMVKAEAVEQFVLGGEVYVTFEPAE